MGISHKLNKMIPASKASFQNLVAEGADRGGFFLLLQNVLSNILQIDWRCLMLLDDISAS